jgi:hypothetical protein
MATNPATLTGQREISGQYKGSGGAFDVQLRIDVDGPSPMQRVSADYVRQSNGESVGSMRVDAPVVLASARRRSPVARCSRFPRSAGA